MQTFIGVAIGIVTLYLGLIGLLFFAQRHLQYHPNSEIPTPSRYGVPEMKSVRFENSAGNPLLAWWRAPAIGRPTLVYFHGNAGHLGDRAEKLKPFLDVGFGVLLAGYRYNAGAGGRPSEEGLLDDGRRALRFVADHGVTSEQLVLYGESLGTGIATQLAAEFAATDTPVAAVVLEAPFTSIADVAVKRYWFAPVRLLLKDNFASVEKISDIQSPLLIGHGGRDSLIPEALGRRLFEAAQQPKSFFYNPEAHHTNLDEYGFIEEVIRFIEEEIQQP